MMASLAREPSWEGSAYLGNFRYSPAYAGRHFCGVVLAFSFTRNALVGMIFFFLAGFSMVTFASVLTVWSKARSRTIARTG